MGDLRGLLLAPATLVLQVAHPTVGAGVADHSDFAAHPWKRLLRTMNSAIRFTYGTDAVARREAAHLHDVHAKVTGADVSGRPYSALDPAAAAWVHLTLGRFGVEIQRVLGEPLSAAQCHAFFAEWRQVGVALGVPELVIPPTWGAFLAYFDSMVEEVLEDNPSVHEVLGVAGHPAAPARWIPGPAWEPVARSAGETLERFTVGTLPAVLRHRFGLAWSSNDERRLRTQAERVRAAFGWVPPPLRYYPQIAPYALGSWWKARAGGA